MKRIFMLIGLAAAAYGIMKLVRGNSEDEFMTDPAFGPSTYDSTYAPQPQA